MNRRTKVVLTILLTLTLLAAVFFITTLRSTHRAEENKQVTAQLYGYRVDGRLILQDRTGHLWEIPYTDEISESDIVLLDVTGYNINHVYVEVITTTAETETENQN